MEDAKAWRRWNAWRYVLEALEEIAPEALEDLARLVPVYREAAPTWTAPVGTSTTGKAWERPWKP
jgi:hypothetical protein